MKKIFSIKTAQSGREYKLSINGLTQLYEKLPPQNPGQQNLFGGPEFNRYYNIVSIDKSKLKTIINAMEGMIYVPSIVMGSSINTIDYDDSYFSDDYLIDLANAYIEGNSQYFEEYLNDNKEDLTDEIEEQIKSFLERNFRKGSDESNEEFLMKVLNNDFFLSYRDSVLYEDVLNSLKVEENKWEDVSSTLARFLTELYILGDISLDDLDLKFTREDGKFSSSLRKILIKPDNIVSSDDVADKYLDDNRRELINMEAENLAESDLYEFNSQDRRLLEDLEIEFPDNNQSLHRTSKFDGIIDAMVNVGRTEGYRAFTEEDFEKLKEIEIDNFLKIINVLQAARGIENASLAAEKMYAHIVFINSIVDTDIGLKHIFEDADLNDVDSSLSTKRRDIFDTYQDEFLDYFKDDFGGIPEKIKQEMSRRQKEALEQEEKKQKYIEKFQYNKQYTPEELENLKKIHGIKPFNMMGKMEVDKQFPGIGSFNDKHGNLKPFRLTIYPEKNSEIPAEVYKNMTLHQVNSEEFDNYSPAFGWVGGFLDHKNNAIWISEVQNDMLQRTFAMRDPAKIIEQKNSEIANLELQKQKVSQPKDYSFQINNLKEKIKTLDKNSPEFLGISNQIKNLELKSQDKNISTNKITEIDNQINNLKLEIEKLSSETTEGFKRFPQYHKFKSKTENMYKSWIEMFFNTIMKYAIEQNVEFVYVITPNSLMARWSNYANKETIILFNRIYDKMAKFYNAIESNDWYKIQVKDISDKIAYNILKSIKTSSIEDEYRLSVLKDNFIRFNKIASELGINKFVKISNNINENFKNLNNHIKCVNVELDEFSFNQLKIIYNETVI